MNRKALLKPVLDDKGRVVLFDMFVDDEWHGSRRTAFQCVMYFRFIGVYGKRD